MAQQGQEHVCKFVACMHIDMSNMLSGLCSMHMPQIYADRYLSPCLQGLPSFEQPCGGWFGPKCPSFTTDPMIGTSVRATAIPYG